MRQFSDSKRFCRDGQNVYKYVELPNGSKGWKRLECYLPPDCATGTYGEPVAETAERWLVEFDLGVRKASMLPGMYVLMDDGRILRQDDEGNPIVPKPRGEHFRKVAAT